MNARRLLMAFCLLVTVACSALRGDSVPSHPFGKSATLRLAGVDQIRLQLQQWLESIMADPAVRVQVLSPWEDLEVREGADLVKLLAESFAKVDPEVRQLVEFCSQPKQAVEVPEFAWLAVDERPPFVRHNLRLLFGRWLAQERLYDEALTQLKDLTADQVIDPATLLFFQSVCHHRLLEKEEGLKSIRRLLDDVQDAPQRYVTVAGLMYEDLRAVEDESLDHISRRMDDIRRRLDLGRSGPKVRKIEDDVVASLDKMIEELEKQRQQQQQQSAGAGGQSRSSSPAPDSRILGGRGPGDVDRKPIGSKSGWGDLPPKQRQEALQQIGKDFPSHYREVIEQYFRKLAGQQPPE